MNKKGKTTIKLGAFITLILLTSSMYFMFEKETDGVVEGIKFRFDGNGAYYEVYEGGRYNLIANEYVRLYNRSTGKRIYAVDRNYFYLNYSGEYYEGISEAKYKNNLTVKMIFEIDQHSDAIENFPVEAHVECYNCVGIRVETWFTGIRYDGETKIIESPFLFDPKMRLEWDDKAYYNKVFNYLTVSDKIIIKFFPENDFERYMIKLVDPPKVKWVYEDVEEKKIKYKVEEICVESNYSIINDTWIEAYCYNQTIFDGYDIKIKKVKTDKFSYKNKFYDKKAHYYEESNEIHSFFVPVGDRDWDNYPCIWESDKDVCEVIKIE